MILEIGNQTKPLVLGDEKYTGTVNIPYVISIDDMVVNKKKTAEVYKLMLELCAAQPNIEFITDSIDSVDTTTIEISTNEESFIVFDKLRNKKYRAALNLYLIVVEAPRIYNSTGVINENMMGKFAQKLKKHLTDAFVDDTSVIIYNKSLTPPMFSIYKR